MPKMLRNREKSLKQNDRDVVETVTVIVSWRSRCELSADYGWLLGILLALQISTSILKQKYSQATAHSANYL